MNRLLNTSNRYFSGSVKEQKIDELPLRDLSTRRKIKKSYDDFMELTKFKLSLLNSVGSYTMFFYYAPLASVGLLESMAFIFATQAVAMSSQCFG